MIRIHWRFTLLAVCVVFQNTFAHAEIRRFIKVADGIYRGSQPTTEQDYNQLQSLGIKTIINLRADDTVEAERAVAKERGIEFKHLPMSVFRMPKAAVIKKALRFLTDPNLQPVFVHCQHGKDRTGLVLGMYRVHFESWHPNKAYREMVDIGFDRRLVNFSFFYWWNTRKRESSSSENQDRALANAN